MMSPYEIERALTLLSNEELSFYHLTVSPHKWFCYQVSGMVGIYETKASAVKAFEKKHNRQGLSITHRVRSGVYNCKIPYKTTPRLILAECRIERITKDNLAMIKEIALKSMLPSWYFVKESPEYQAFHGPTEVNR